MRKSGDVRLLVGHQHQRKRNSNESGSSYGDDAGNQDSVSPPVLGAITSVPECCLPLGKCGLQLFLLPCLHSPSRTLTWRNG